MPPDTAHPSAPSPPTCASRTSPLRCCAAPKTSCGTAWPRSWRAPRPTAACSKGDPGNTLSRPEIEAKTLSLGRYADAASETELRGLIGAIWNLERAGKVEALLALTPGPVPACGYASAARCARTRPAMPPSARPSIASSSARVKVAPSPVPCTSTKAPLPVMMTLTSASQAESSS